MDFEIVEVPEFEKFINIISEISKEISLEIERNQIESTIITIKKIFCNCSGEIILMNASNSLKVDAISKLYDTMNKTINELENSRSFS